MGVFYIIYAIVSPLLYIIIPLAIITGLGFLRTSISGATMDTLGDEGSDDEQSGDEAEQQPHDDGDALEVISRNIQKPTFSFTDVAKRIRTLFNANPHLTGAADANGDDRGSKYSDDDHDDDDEDNDTEGVGLSSKKDGRGVAVVSPLGPNGNNGNIGNGNTHRHSSHHPRNGGGNSNSTNNGRHGGNGSDQQTNHQRLKPRRGSVGHNVGDHPNKDNNLPLLQVIKNYDENLHQQQQQLSEISEQPEHRDHGGGKWSTPPQAHSPPLGASAATAENHDGDHGSIYARRGRRQTSLLDGKTLSVQIPSTHQQPVVLSGNSHASNRSEVSDVMNSDSTMASSSLSNSSDPRHNHDGMVLSPTTSLLQSRVGTPNTPPIPLPSASSSNSSSFSTLSLSQRQPVPMTTTVQTPLSVDFPFPFPASNGGHLVQLNGGTVNVSTGSVFTAMMRLIRRAGADGSTVSKTQFENYIRTELAAASIDSFQADLLRAKLNVVCENNIAITHHGAETNGGLNGSAFASLSRGGIGLLRGNGKREETSVATSNDGHGITASNNVFARLLTGQATKAAEQRSPLLHESLKMSAPPPPQQQQHSADNSTAEADDSQVPLVGESEETMESHRKLNGSSNSIIYNENGTTDIRLYASQRLKNAAQVAGLGVLPSPLPSPASTNTTQPSLVPATSIVSSNSITPFSRLPSELLVDPFDEQLVGSATPDGAALVGGGASTAISTLDAAVNSLHWDPMNQVVPSLPMPWQSASSVQFPPFPSPSVASTFASSVTVPPPPPAVFASSFIPPPSPANSFVEASDSLSNSFFHPHYQLQQPHQPNRGRITLSQQHQLQHQHQYQHQHQHQQRQQPQHQLSKSHHPLLQPHNAQYSHPPLQLSVHPQPPLLPHQPKHQRHLDFASSTTTTDTDDEVLSHVQHQPPNHALNMLLSAFPATTTSPNINSGTMNAANGQHPPLTTATPTRSIPPATVSYTNIPGVVAAASATAPATTTTFPAAISNNSTTNPTSIVAPSVASELERSLQSVSARLGALRQQRAAAATTSGDSGAHHPMMSGHGMIIQNGR